MIRRGIELAKPNTTKLRKRQWMRYPGVTRNEHGTFEVRILRPRTRPLFVGTWPTEREAAIIQDRVGLYLGLDRSLNFPKHSRALGPISLEEARQLARPVMKKQDSTSRYVGVVRSEGGWKALVSANGHTATVGSFRTERDAAIARDRLALGLHAGPFLNFPDSNLTAASAAELRQELRRSTRQKRDMPFIGIQPRPQNRQRPWGARVNISGKLTFLGYWPTAQAAAEAHDRVALHFDRDASLLNFPDRIDELRPASVAEIRAEARRLRIRSSTYFGVEWSERHQAWTAHVTANGKKHFVGAFAKKKQAALAHDEAAVRMFGERARLNFKQLSVRA